MTGDLDKNHKQKLVVTDESSSGIHGVGGTQVNESNNSSCNTPNALASALTTRTGEDQPLFKKPRLDVSFVMLLEFQYDDGSIILKNCDNLKPDDGRNGQDCSSECVSECSTCGDIGFQSELFRCTKCSVRLQHTYCSNTYNPRKRWFIRLCNWCKMDVPHTATPGGSSKQAAAIPSSIHQNNTQAGGQLSNRRDNSNNSPWLEKRSAVDCLLGAALRLPSPGLSNMEELLPHATRALKGKRSHSFDTVEKAKRSGPSCDTAVKMMSKRSSGSLSSSGSIGGAGKALQNPTLGDSCVHKDEKPSLLKRSHSSHLQYSKAAMATPGDGNADGKENLRDTTPSNGDSAEKRAAARFESGSGTESEKPSTATTVAKISPSFSFTKNRKSPVGDYDDKSETTVDNTVRTSSRRSPSTCGSRRGVAAPMKSEDDGCHDEEMKIKERISRVSGEKSKPAGPQDSSPRSIKRSRDHKESGGGGRASARGASAATTVAARNSSSSGGSDCSNVTEVQRIESGDHRHGHGNSSSPRETPLRKSLSFKQQQQSQARLVRPSLIIGKSKSHAMETSKTVTPKRFSDLKDSKLRRSSNSPRVSGAHFKCLSDILC